MRKSNIVYHGLRLERKCDPILKPEPVTEPADPPFDPNGEDGPSRALIPCYHAERSNTTIPYGHPFFLPVYPTDSVPLIKKRIQEKLKVPEREFKQWRLGKVFQADQHAQLFEQVGSRHLLRDEDNPEELKQFFFNRQSQRRICIEHTHPPVSNPNWFGESAAKIRSKVKTHQLTIK